MSKIKQLMLANMQEKFGYITRLIPEGKLIQRSNMQIVNCGKNSDTFNTVFGVPSSEDDVRLVTEYYLGNKLSAAWWFDASQLSDFLKNSLSSMGWECEEKEVGMSYDLPETLPRYKNPKLKIIQCKTSKDFEEFGMVLSAIFEEDNPIEAENVRQVYKLLNEEKAKEHGKMIFLLGYENDVPVSTMTLYFSHNLAGLFDLSTLPRKRKKGYGSEMFSYSLHIAKAEGIKRCVLEASEDGLRIYERAGFKPLGEFYVWNLQSL